MTNVTYKYATVLVAIQNLRNEGYNVDFNLEENCLICGDNKYTIDDFGAYTDSMSMAMLRKLALKND